MFKIRIAVKVHNNVLPLINMGNELIRIILEAEKFITVGRIDMNIELVLNPLPRSEVRRVLIPVLPDRPPAGKHRNWRSGADLLGRSWAAFAEALQHQSMRLLVESVELGGNMRLGANVRRRRGMVITTMVMVMMIHLSDAVGIAATRVIRVRVWRKGRRWSG